MKKLFSIFTALLIGGASIALAMHVNQQDPLCFEPEHEGYIYTGIGDPPEGSSPENLPANMTSAGIYEEDFDCELNPTERCHWVYNEAEAKWKPCEGTYVDLR